MICLSATIQPFSFFFYLFHLVHFESFHIEYLAALAFLQLLLHWVDVGELCLTEQPLAVLQSKRLTAVFFHLCLSLTFPRLPFTACGPAAYKCSHILSHIQILNPLLTSAYLSHIKIDSGTQLYFLFLIMLIMLTIQPSSLKICVGNGSIKLKVVGLSRSFHL